ncbi:MAG: hypothetical protein ACXW27_01345 [Allosphingosinicella sp.]
MTHGLRCATGENHRDDDEPPEPRDSRCEAAEVLDPCHRRPRRDGWLPWKKAQFLLVLVAGGVVADACRAVGMSVASAYALKNRRSGRAFGKMWDAVMIHRARGRLADNNLSRAMNGCVEQVLKDGVVIAERRRFDNRLSMAMLTRLDRLAESKSGEESALLRALSEDFEDYVEVVEAGGDEDAFLEAHRSQPEEQEVTERAAPWYKKDFLDNVAAMSGASPWRHIDPPEIPIDDLDPDRMDDWSLDGWIRAIRSYYLDWLEMYRDSGEARPDGPDCPAAYDRVRRDIMASIAADAEGEDAPTSSPSLLGECAGADCRGQSAPEHDHAEHGGGVTGEADGGLSANHQVSAAPTPPPACGWSPSPSLRDREDEVAWQPSTSSTSPGPAAPEGGEES